MSRPGPSNPLGYVMRRQYNDKLPISKLLLRERLSSAKNLYRKDLLAHYGCVNAIEFSNEGELLASGGDDRRVLLWKVEEAVQGMGTPAAMKAQHISNIFCLGYDSTNSKIFSAGNDDQVIVHDTRTGDPLDYFVHEQPVYGISIDPLNDNVFASACDDGRVLIFDIREPAGTEPFCLAMYTSPFHAVMFNPVEPRLLTTANSKEGVGLWDVRKPQQVLLRYGGHNASQSCMSVRFNRRGTHVLALRRRLPPVLYAVHSTSHVCQFDHPGYYNSCTMKSCCFAGENDEYVLSGSDDFNLYVWKIPPSENRAWIDTAHMILKGHRSIVNQVRFNHANFLIASSGVEKLIKFWSPFPLPQSTGGLVSEATIPEKERKVYTHEEYISLVLRSGQFMSHDYSHQSTQEDPRMMAFFDSLVQREIEGWNTDDSLNSEASTAYQESVHDPLPSSGVDSDSGNSDSHQNELQALAAAYAEALDARSNNNNDENVESTGNEDEDRQLHEDNPNRIAQLIAKKRAQLMRLAHARANNEKMEKPRLKRKVRYPTLKHIFSAAHKDLDVSSNSDDDSSDKRKKPSDDSDDASSDDSTDKKSDSDKNTTDNSSSPEKDVKVRCNNGKNFEKKKRKRRLSHSGSSNDGKSMKKSFISKEIISDTDSDGSNVDSPGTSGLANNVNSSTSQPEDALWKHVRTYQDRMAQWRMKWLRQKREKMQKSILMTDSSSDSDEPSPGISKVPKPVANPDALTLDSKTNNIDLNCTVDADDGVQVENDCDTNTTGDEKCTMISMHDVNITPNGKQNNSQGVGTPDSGIVILPCSSIDLCVSNSNHAENNTSDNITEDSCNHQSENFVGNGSQNDEGASTSNWVVFKRFKNRLDRSRRNYRYRNQVTDPDSS